MTVWQPKINSALMDLKRIAKGLFLSAISVGNLLTEAGEAFGREVDWLADLNVAITVQDQKFYMALAQGSQGIESRLTPMADAIPRKAMELIDVAYHAAMQTIPADEEDEEEDYFGFDE